jgi:hypothetical protein
MTTHLPAHLVRGLFVTTGLAVSIAVAAASLAGPSSGPLPNGRRDTPDSAPTGNKEAVVKLAAPNAQDFPHAEISNAQVRASLYLPDAEKGYYRGTRFDWSGVIASLRYEDHEYFGVWFPRYDPKLHDAITGPVEEFRVGDTALGYKEAKPGETFLQIGVGALHRPDEPAYRRFGTYEIADPGEWTVATAPDRVELVHVLRHPAGYAYRYTKVVRLEQDRPELVIEHRLENTGTRPLEVSQYNHNFFVIDAQATGPDSVITFAFGPRAKNDLKGLATVGERQLKYVRELAAGETVMTEIEGFGPGAADYDFRIENRKAGAGVQITGDRPLSKIIYWSIRTTLCPEPYIDIEVPVGQESRWTLRYLFYTLKR